MTGPVGHLDPVPVRDVARAGGFRIDVDEGLLVEILHPVEVHELGMDPEFRVGGQHPQLVVGLAALHVFGQGVEAVLRAQVRFELVFARRGAELAVGPGGR